MNASFTQPDVETVARTARQRAIMALALLIPVPTLGTAAALWFWPDASIGRGLFALAKLWILVLPVAWLRLVDRQPLSWSPPRLGGFGVAAVLGLAIAGAILAAYRVVLHLGVVDSVSITERLEGTGLDRQSTYIVGAAYWITLNSMMEEYVWRWFVFRKLEALMPGGVAVVAAGLAFAAHHVVALAAYFGWVVTGLASMGVCIGGMIWSWLYLRYRSVWPCYLSHAIVDIPIFWIGYELLFRQAR